MAHTLPGSVGFTAGKYIPSFVPAGSEPARPEALGHTGDATKWPRPTWSGLGPGSGLGLGPGFGGGLGSGLGEGEGLGLGLGLKVRQSGRGPPRRAWATCRRSTAYKASPPEQRLGAPTRPAYCLRRAPSIVSVRFAGRVSVAATASVAVVSTTIPRTNCY